MIVSVAVACALVAFGLICTGEMVRFRCGSSVRHSVPHTFATGRWRVHHLHHGQTPACFRSTFTLDAPVADHCASVRASACADAIIGTRDTLSVHDNVQVKCQTHKTRERCARVHASVCIRSCNNRTLLRTRRLAKKTTVIQLITERTHVRLAVTITDICINMLVHARVCGRPTALWVRPRGGEFIWSSQPGASTRTCPTLCNTRVI